MQAFTGVTVYVCTMADIWRSGELYSTSMTLLYFVLTAVEEEIPEVYQQIQKLIKNLVRDGSTFSGTVPGGNYQMLASLAGLMGELRLHDREHRRQIDDMKIRLKEKGKSAQDIALAVQDRYEQIISGWFVFLVYFIVYKYIPE